jgi:hypothetical protein
MVFWMDYRNGSDYDIFGRRLGADGAPLGDAFALLDRDSTQGAPHAAYNSAEQVYTVVFHSYEGTEGFDILAQRVAQDGDPLGEPILLSGATLAGDEGFPRVAYNSEENELLVVWHAFTDASWNVYAHRLGADGTLLGDLIAVSESPHAQEYPAVAYNAGSNEYIVTWQDKRDGNQYDIYVQRIASGGVLLGRNSRISADSSEDSRPDVAFAVAREGYLIVWQRIEDEDSDIYGRWLSSAGAPSGPELAISSKPGDQAMPAVNLVPLAMEHLVAWEDYSEEEDSSDVLAQRISSVLGLVGAPLVVASADGYQASPALPNPLDSTELTVVWEDYRNANWDVYGQQIRLPAPILYLPLLVN